MSQKRNEPIRVSAWQAAMECGVTLNKVTSGLKANNITPGKDDKYSLKDIVTALSSRSGLEQKAKEAKYKRQIDEAEIAKIEREEKRGKLAPIQLLEAYAADIIVQCVGLIRHSSLTEKEKKQFVEQLRVTKFEPKHGK